jgi:hypothetical protein
MPFRVQLTALLASLLFIYILYNDRPFSYLQNSPTVLHNLTPTLIDPLLSSLRTCLVPLHDALVRQTTQFLARWGENGPGFLSGFEQVFSQIWGLYLDWVGMGPLNDPQVANDHIDSLITGWLHRTARLFWGEKAVRR